MGDSISVMGCMVIYEPSRDDANAHVCPGRWTGDREFKAPPPISNGAIIRCTCGRYFRFCEATLSDCRWKPVRWYNFSAVKKIEEMRERGVKW